MCYIAAWLNDAYYFEKDVGFIDAFGPKLKFSKSKGL